MPIVNATNNGDTYLAASNATSNYSSETFISVGFLFTSTNRGLIKFTLPTLSGVITELKLKVYGNLTEAGSRNINLYLCSRSDAEPSEATWNIYKTGSNWTTPGGDFEAAEIDSLTITETPAWHTFHLIGPEATNPITPEWGNTYTFVLRRTSSGFPYANLNSKENAENNPILEITYNPTISGVSSTTGLSSITF